LGVSGKSEPSTAGNNQKEESASPKAMLAAPTPNRLTETLPRE